MEWSANLGGVVEASVIDGQQRLTTCSLLLYALAIISREQGNESWYSDIMHRCIINQNKEGEKKYKLLPTKLDKEKYISVIEWLQNEEDDDFNIVNNYNFFKEKIREYKDDLDTVYKGISKLFIVDIALDRTQDNPQLIFESMNSTGLALSKAELIKNYLLMGLRNQEQTSLYEQYRYPMDKILENNTELYDMFIRDYLTFKSKSGKIPNLRSLYDEFKAFLKNENKTTEEVLKDIAASFKYYAKFTLLKPEFDEDIAEALQDIDTLQVNVAYPLMLELFLDNEAGIISKEHLVKILRLIESYVFRRAICGIPTNSLNKTFSTFKKNLKKDSSQSYYQSFLAHLMTLDSYKAFPNDEVFEAEILIKDVYNFRNAKYLLQKLENYNKKEKVLADNYTIEHIMPQNTKNNKARQDELGENWKEVYEAYLHTIGNITLTGYNSEYSDRSFQEKKTMEGKWFNYSPVGLNWMIRDIQVWNKEAILLRANKLATMAKNVRWYEKLDEETLALYKEEEEVQNKVLYTYEDHKFLNGDVMELFQKLKEKILLLHPDVKEEIKWLYIAFKYQTNFVDIVPQKDKLRLSLNMDYEEIKDPEWICKDITWLGRRGNGNVELRFDNKSDIEYVSWLIRQSFDKQFE